MELFKILGTIAVDNTKANNAIDDTTKKAKSSENETSGAFSKIGAVAGTVATGIGVAGAAIGGAFIAAVESTEECRTERGSFEWNYLSYWEQ